MKLAPLRIDYEFFSSLLYRRLREDCQHSSHSSADAIHSGHGQTVRGGGGVDVGVGAVLRLTVGAYHLLTTSTFS
jgi:hypothetical protein